MDKQAVQKMLNMDDIERLLNGEKTNLKNFTLNMEGRHPDIGGTEGVSAKFFLKRLDNHQIELRLIEQSPQINNRFNVSELSLEKLKKGETVIEKDLKNAQNYLYQLDKETNSLMRINQVKFTVPDAIKDVQLSQNQKEALRNGQSIELKKATKSLRLRLILIREIYSLSKKMKVFQRR